MGNDNEENNHTGERDMDWNTPAFPG
jgi:hypothetical protein